MFTLGSTTNKIIFSHTQTQTQTHTHTHTHTHTPQLWNSTIYGTEAADGAGDLIWGQVCPSYTNDWLMRMKHSLSLSLSSCGLCFYVHLFVFLSATGTLQHRQWVELISLNMKKLPMNWEKKEGVRKRGEERLLKVVCVCVCVQMVMQLINLNTLLQRVARTLSKFDVIVSHCVSCLDRQTQMTDILLDK